MSLKRNIQKRLRLARPHEQQFREIVAYREAFVKLGVNKLDIGIDFVRSVKDDRDACTPMVSVKTPPGFGLKLVGFDVIGSHEHVSKLWREWLIELMGHDEDIPEHVADAFWYKSKVSLEHVDAKLREMIEKAGIKLGEKS